MNKFIEDVVGIKRPDLEWDTSNDLDMKDWKGKRPGDKKQPKQQTQLEKYKVL